MSNTKVVTSRELQAALDNPDQWTSRQTSVEFEVDSYTDELGNDVAYGEVSVISTHKDLGITVKYTASFNYYFETDEDYNYFHVSTEGLEDSHIYQCVDFYIDDEDDEYGYDLDIPNELCQIDINNLIETIRKYYGHEAVDEDTVCLKKEFFPGHWLITRPDDQGKVQSTEQEQPVDWQAVMDEAAKKEQEKEKEKEQERGQYNEGSTQTR